MPEIKEKAPAVLVAERRERLALNLWDITDEGRLPADIRDLLLRDKLRRDREAVVRVDEDRPDETAVPFSCDLLTAACIVDTIREHDRRAGDRPCRAYLNRGGKAWERLAGDVRLTVVAGGNVILNPKLFRAAVSGAAGQRKLEKVEW